MNNTGQIFKSKSTEKFTVIPNAMIQRPDLSAKAKGLLCYILSLPSDWVINKSEVHKHFKDGLDAIRSGFKELEKAGYILSVEIRNDKGHFKGYNYIVYDEPQLEKPISENPISVKPISENPTLQKKQLTKETVNKEIINNIIEDLNLVLGKNYKTTTKPYRDAISARLNEGYTEDDFKHVHRCMFKLWKGTDQEQYLTPDTLYRPSKFPKYVNTEMPKNKPTKKSTHIANFI